MVSRRTDRLLQKITHHTNLEQPYNQYITGYKYPKQDTDKLGTIIQMKYRNRYIPNSLTDIDRQIDPDREYEYNDNTFERDFIVLRYDDAEPYRLITIQDDFEVMLVSDTRKYQDIVHIYPKQIEEFLGLYMHDQYFHTPDVIIKSVLLRCDSTEPCESIIAELYLDNTIRFVTGTETQAVVMDRYDIDGVRDYDAKDPVDHGLIYIDLNGKFARSEGETITVDADGGYPDPLADMYRRDILSFEELCDLRQRLILERDIYSGNNN